MRVRCLFAFIPFWLPFITEPHYNVGMFVDGSCINRCLLTLPLIVWHAQHAALHSCNIFLRANRATASCLHVGCQIIGRNVRAERLQMRRERRGAAAATQQNTPHYSTRLYME